MLRLVSDPVVIAALALLGVVLVMAAFYLNNLHRKRLDLPALTFGGFLRAFAATLMQVADNYTPVLRTRTGAHATAAAVANALGIAIAAPHMDMSVTVLCIAANVYLWVRTLHGRYHAKAIEPAASNWPRADAQTTPDETAAVLGFGSYAAMIDDYKAFCRNDGDTPINTPEPLAPKKRRQAAARPTRGRAGAKRPVRPTAKKAAKSIKAKKKPAAKTARRKRR